jgi:CrcB protein
MMLKNILLVGAGGMIGSIARYLIYLLIRNSSFPAATLFVNLVGSLVIGFVAGLAMKNADFPMNWKLFIATGICGGFTTFSAFSLDNYELIHQGKTTLMLIYVVSSIVLGILLTFAGVYLAKIVN